MRCSAKTAKGLRCLSKCQQYSALCYNHKIKEVTCSICLDKPNKPKTLKCGHVFCNLCINIWLDKNYQCPYCRCQIKKQPLTVHFSHDVNMIDLAIRLLQPQLRRIYNETDTSHIGISQDPHVHNIFINDTLTGELVAHV